MCSNLLFTPFFHIRPDPIPRVSFLANSPSPKSLTLRIGSKPGYQNGICSCKLIIEEPICENKSCCFYELLGIPETGTCLEIKQAYKQLVRKYHPDVSPPDRVGEYTQKFIWVQRAYETLSDPNRRALYDKERANDLGLASGARNYVEQVEENTEWKTRWQAQVCELKRRSMYKDSGTTSWGARMRKKNNDSSPHA